MAGLKSVKSHGRTFDVNRMEPDVNKSNFNLKIIYIWLKNLSFVETFIGAVWFAGCELQKGL